MKDQTKGLARFSTSNHPLMQAPAWSMPELYDWQREILEEAALPGARVAAAFNNAAGKTSILVPLLGLSVMAAFPGATVFSTAGAEPQIKGQLFKYLNNILRPYADSGWAISLSDLTVRAPKIRGLQSNWVARVPRDAMTMEGYHGSWETDSEGERCWCPVCVIIDEAKSVDQEVFEAAWRIEPDFLLVISTPGEDTGPFFEAVDPDTLDGGMKRDHDALWTYRRKINRRDCPHLQTPAKIRYLKQLVEKFGQRSSFIKSFSEGEFQRQTDENNVFTDTDLDRMKRAMKPKEHYSPGRKFAGLEFSGGGDEQPIMILDGNKVVYEQVWREEDTNKLANDFLTDLKRFDVRPQDAIADNGGIGQAIIDNMESKVIDGKQYRGMERYMNQQVPMAKHEYADRMTEDHYRFKEMIRMNPDIQIPDDPILMKQMRQRRYHLDDHNKVKLQPKKEHRKRTQESPDRLDAIVMLFSRWRPPVKEVKKTEYHSSLEEEARKRGGKGEQAAFGWMKPQQSMDSMMRQHKLKA